MAKPVFRANFCRITNIYEKLKELPKVKQKQNDQRKVPPMPTMRWNKDATPCCAHLEEEVATTTKRVKGKGGQEFYTMRKINWKEA